MKVFARGHIQNQNGSPYFEELMSNIAHKNFLFLFSERTDTRRCSLHCRLIFVSNQRAKQEEKAFFIGRI